MHGLQVTALIRNPHRLFVDQRFDESLDLASRTTRNGTLAVELRRDMAQTIALAPDRWKQVSKRPRPVYRPTGAGNPPPQAYAIPGLVRAQSHVKYVAGLSEHSWDCPDIAGVQIVTGKQGQQLRPYYAGKNAEGEDCQAIARFAGQLLGYICWNQRSDYRSFDVGQVRIHKRGNYAVVERTILLKGINAPGPPEAPRLKSELANWQPALNAVYERLQCQGDCEYAHYALPLGL